MLHSAQNLNVESEKNGAICFMIDELTETIIVILSDEVRALSRLLSDINHDSLMRLDLSEEFCVLDEAVYVVHDLDEMVDINVAQDLFHCDLSGVRWMYRVHVNVESKALNISEDIREKPQRSW